MSSSDYDLTYVKQHLDLLLTTRAYPKTLCPSEAARALSAAELDQSKAAKWRDLMPALREIAFELRDAGKVEILQKGLVLPFDQTREGTVGPIRLRRVLSVVKF